MKLFLFFLVGFSFLISCSPYREPTYTKRKPGHHIHQKDKNALKENMKHRDNHAKAVKKKREQLNIYNPEPLNTELPKSKKKKK